MAASSSTVTITEYPSLYTETAWVHTHGSESNEEVPVVMGKREWSGMWGGGAQAVVQFMGNDGWVAEGWERGSGHSLHLRACKADSAPSLSWTLHFSETASVF